ncbi:MAG: hypothetical protein OCC45_07865 [Desulfotalea sp.]
MKAEKKNKIGRQGKIIKYVVIAFILLLFTGIACVPFVFQTTTLWYKVGIDRAMLFAGQIFGLFAAAIIFLQLVIIAKLSFMTQAFGQRKLNKIHQFNGKFIIALAFLHILLILLPEGLTNLPIGLKFWPEMIGGVLFLVLLTLYLSVWMRTRFKIKYAVWKSLHRMLGLFAFVAVLTHVVNTSDAFDNESLYIAFIVISGISFFLFFWGKYSQK